MVNTCVRVCFLRNYTQLNMGEGHYRVPEISSIIILLVAFLRSMAVLRENLFAGVFIHTRINCNVCVYRIVRVHVTS